MGGAHNCTLGTPPEFVPYSVAMIGDNVQRKSGTTGGSAAARVLLTGGFALGAIVALALALAASVRYRHGISPC